MKTRRSTVLAILAVTALFSPGCNKARDSGSTQARSGDARRPRFGRFTIPELEAKMAEAKAGQLQLFIYDNNEKERYVQSHLPGARWVEFDEIKASDLPADKEATLVFYCANDH